MESGFCKKIKLKSYPLVKIGPVLWTYMGPPEKQPPLPEWEFSLVPPDQVFISKRLQESNWLQAMEGGIDSSHVSFLHRGDLGSDPLFKGAKGNKYNLSDLQPHFESRRAATIRCTATSGCRSTITIAGPGPTTSIRPGR
jgi:phenylpropionate dioxygenase-like ring-hydroxylating dioxygenase large terminal subunit